MSGVYTQTRDLSYLVRVRQQVTPVGTTPTGPWYEYKLPGQQVTTSYRSGELADRLEAATPDTNIWRRPQGGMSSEQDTGHEFYSRKDQFLGSSWTFRDWKSTSGLIGGYERHQDGPLIITSPVEIGKHCYPTVPKLSQDGGAAMGTEMIHRSLPTSASTNMTQALAELLSEGIRVPNLDFRPSRKTVEDAYGHAADGYLTYEFGWKPLYSDVVSLINSLKKANAIIRQYSRDSGKFVRRRSSLPATSRTTETYVGSDTTTGTGASVSNIGWQRLTGNTYTSEFKTDVWFSGSFTYFVPVSDDMMSKLERFEALANKVLGVRAQADTLWELTPWSWLIDWVTNVGDVLSNGVAFQNDGLVMRYGYLMRRTRIRTVCSANFSYPANAAGDRKTVTVTNLFTSDVKERMRATPFGFGLTTTAFSGRQWAILAALGISRAPSSL